MLNLAQTGQPAAGNIQIQKSVIEKSLKQASNGHSGEADVTVDTDFVLLSWSFVDHKGSHIEVDMTILENAEVARDYFGWYLTTFHREPCDSLEKPEKMENPSKSIGHLCLMSSSASLELWTKGNVCVEVLAGEGQTIDAEYSRKLDEALIDGPQQTIIPSITSEGPIKRMTSWLGWVLNRTVKVSQRLLLVES